MSRRRPGRHPPLQLHLLPVSQEPGPAGGPWAEDSQCGSDGRTYSNPCLLECAKEKCPTLTKGLTLARPGACPDPAAQEVARRPNPLLAAVEKGQLVAHCPCFYPSW